MNKDFTCSASTLNLFITDPCLFILKHYYRLRGDFGIHAMRGKAIEHGVDKALEGMSLDKAKDAAVEEFYDLTFELDHDFEEVEDIIPKWIDNALDVLKTEANGRVPELQKKLEFELEGINFVGYLDYDFEDETIDLKTTTKVPKLLVKGKRKGMLPAGKAANVRQQVLYRYTTGKPQSLLYVSPKDSLKYTIQDKEYETVLEEIKKVTKEIKKLLTEGEEYGINKYVPNQSLFKGFYYNEKMVHKVIELWKLDDRKL